MSTSELTELGPVQSLVVNRSMVDGVIESPGGAHFTTAAPDYGRDEMFQKHYVDSAKDPDAWPSFVDRFLSGDEAAYQAEVRKFSKEAV